jgi:hypothetical protein
MAGIADVQPKSIGAISLPVIPAAVDPVTYNPPPTPDFATALAQMNAATQSVKDNSVRAAGRQVALEQAAETLDPTAIQARKAATALALVQTQNTAGSLGSEDLVSLYRAVHGTDAFDANGNKDYEAMKRGGVDIHNAMWHQQRGLQGMTPIMQPYAGPNGQPMMRVINAFGDLFYDPKTGAENKRIQDYRDEYQNAGDVLHTHPDDTGNTPANVVPLKPGASAPPQPSLMPTIADDPPAGMMALPKPVVAPAPTDLANTDPIAAKTWLVDAGIFPGGTPSDLSDQEAIDAYKGYQAQIPRGLPLVTPTPAAAAVAPPVVQPKSTTIDTGDQKITVTPNTAVATPGTLIQPGQTDYMGGIPVGLAPNQLNTPVAIRENLNKDAGYQNWKLSTGELAEVKSLEADPLYSGKSPAQQNKQNMNTFDFRLGQAVANLTNPKTAEGRSSYKIEELDLKQPYLNKYVKNIKEVLLGRGKFTPQTRAELLGAAQGLAQAKQDSGRGAVQAAIAQYQRSNLWPTQQADFTPDELALAQSAGPSATPGQGPPQGQPFIDASGKKIMRWRQ